LLFLLLCLISGNSVAEPIRIGVLIPPPEAGSGVDMPYLRGAEIAVAEINANEGKQGTQLLLLVRRGDFLGRKDLGALRDLFLDDRVNFLMGAVRREAVLPASRLAQDYGIPFLTFPINFMEAASTGEEPPNLFWISPAPEAFQRAAVRTMAQFNKKKFYFLARDSAAGRGWVKYSREELARLRPDARSMGETYLSPGTKDFSPYVESVLASRAEVCLSYLGVKDWISFYQAANKQKYFKKVIHFELESGNVEALIGLQNKFPEGIWGVTAFPFWALGGKETKDFVTKFRANTGLYPDLPALSGYSSICAVFEAMRKAGSLESEKVIRALDELTFRTPVGQMSIRKSDHRAMWPIWSGITQETSLYPFAILGELKAMGPDSFSPR
jgi:branched-chain amino acid transport system substrate-binding protein